MRYGEKELKIAERGYVMPNFFPTHVRDRWVWRWMPVLIIVSGVVAGVLLPHDTVFAQEMQPQTYTVIAGGGAPYNTDILAFAPSALEVHRGDTVQWVFAGFHNVHFAEGLTEIIIAPDVDGQPTPQLNPAVVFPNVENGGLYQGGDANSGLALDPTSPMFAFSLVMDVEPGTYAYFCDIHPGMIGTITVVDDSTPIPSPDEALTMASAEMNANAGMGIEAAIGASLTPPVVVDGAVQVTAGLQAGPAAVQAFFPTIAVIEVGQQVTWTLPSDSREAHTITSPFMPPGSEFTALPQEGAPPIIALNENAFPSVENGAAVGVGDSFNSGLLFPGQAFTLTFTEPGVYSYVCFLHSGMQGAVVVTPPTAD